MVKDGPIGNLMELSPPHTSCSQPSVTASAFRVKTRQTYNYVVSFGGYKDVSMVHAILIYRICFLCL